MKPNFIKRMNYMSKKVLPRDGNKLPRLWFVLGQEKDLIGGSCRFNPVYKTGQRIINYPTIYKRVNPITMRLTNVSCRIILPLTCLDLNNSLKGR